MIWYADLNGPTSDPYPEFEQKPTVIAAKHMNAIDGDVASPAELKRQIDELKAELKEKFHISEQSRLYNRSLLTVFLGLLISVITGILGWIVLKPTFDRSAPASEPPILPASKTVGVPSGADTQPEKARTSPSEKSK